MNEETLLEQMTRVRPEVLNEEGLKLFNKIMEAIDERDDLQQRIDKAIEYIKDNTNYDKEMNYRFFICADETCHANDLLKILGGDVDDE